LVFRIIFHRIEIKAAILLPDAPPIRVTVSASVSVRVRLLSCFLRKNILFAVLKPADPKPNPNPKHVLFAVLEPADPAIHKLILRV